MALAALAWIAGLVIAFVFARFVPQQYEVESDQEIQELQQQLRSKGSLSEDELKRTEQRGKEILDNLRRKMATESFADQLVRVQNHALFVSWIPWALLAILALTQVQDLLAVLTIVAILLASGLTSTFEAAIFLVAIGTVLVLKQIMRKVKVQLKR